MKFFFIIFYASLTLGAENVLQGSLKPSSDSLIEINSEYVNHLRPLLNASKISDESKLFLYFWATWCPDCRDKLTHGTLVDLQKEFPKISVITVNSDSDEMRGKTFSENEKIGLPVFRDEEKSLTKSLKIFALPSWAILEKSSEGKWIVRMHSTGSDLADIRSELNKMF